MYMFVWMYNLLWNDGKKHGLTPLSVLQRDARYADNPVEITECKRCVFVDVYILLHSYTHVISATVHTYIHMYIYIQYVAIGKVISCNVSVVFCVQCIVRRMKHKV